jgi:hypothetical protein
MDWSGHLGFACDDLQQGAALSTWRLHRHVIEREVSEIGGSTH